MQSIFPARLKKGSHLRVIAPSRSASILSSELVNDAVSALKKEGFTVSFGKHIYEKDEFLSTSTKSRIEDLHDAFADKSVDGILTVIGGYNANQLLSKIDYGLIKQNPKVLCGYSDITVLSNAIFAKTGLVTYSGPHFSTWGMQKGFDYTRNYFKDVVGSTDTITIEPSPTWSDDPWFLNQGERNFIKNEGHIAINLGSAKGTIIGSHARCLAALQGTEYWPSLKNSILFLEEDEEIDGKLFDRLLESLVQQKDFSGVKGIIIGKFQKASKTSPEMVKEIVKRKPELNKIPVICNFEIGHTSPIATFPIGGQAEIIANKNKTVVKLVKH